MVFTVAAIGEGRPDYTRAIEFALVVAASDSTAKSKNNADYICDGVNDHVEIQAALDALPAAGGEVLLLEGTFNIEVSIALDSYQTLRGRGRSTILTTTTANLDIITATGSDGSEKVGILIADLCIDGNAGGVASDIGIFWRYVDYSKIRNVFSLDNEEDGIELQYCDFNIVVNNVCQQSDMGIYLYKCTNSIINGNTIEGNTDEGIFIDSSDLNMISDNNCRNDVASVMAAGIRLLHAHYNIVSSNICQASNDYGIRVYDCNHNTIIGNFCQGNGHYGIWAMESHNNTISGNTCQGNGKDGIYIDDGNGNTVNGNTCQGNDDDGIIVTGDNNTVSGNTCRWNGEHGIQVYHSDNCTVIGNTCVGNSQVSDNADDNIYLKHSDHNLVEGNLCRAPTIGTTLTVGEPAAETEIAVTDTTGFEVGMGVVIDLGGVDEEYHRISHISPGAPGVITIDAGLTNAQGAGKTIDVPEAQYGINISNDACDRNCLIGNDLYDSGKTGDLNDVPTTNPTLKKSNRDLAGTGWLAEV